MGSVLDLGNLHIRISADSAVADSVQARFLTNIDRTAARLERAGARMSVAITAPLALVGAGVSKTIMSFDQSMTKALSIMSETGAGIRKEMEGVARAISRESIQRPEELASAYFHLAQAGLTAQQSMASLKPVANFATGAMIDLEKATTLLITSQSALGLASEDPVKQLANLERVSNVLTKAANMTTASQEGLAVALTSKAAGAARILGKDVEETVAVLSAFAKVGVTNEVAGERLDIVWRDLGQAMQKHEDEWRKLGLAIYNVNGKSRNTADIFEDLERVLKPMNDQQKVAALAMLGFQYRSVSAIKSLLGLSGVMRDTEQQLREVGNEADRLAKVQMQSLENKLKNLMARFGDAKLQLEDDFRGAFQKLVDTGQKVIAWWNDLSSAERRYIAVGTIVVAAAGPMLLIFGQLASAVSLAFKAMMGLSGGAMLLVRSYLSLRKVVEPGVSIFAKTATAATAAATATLAVAEATDKATRSAAAYAAVNDRQIAKRVSGSGLAEQLSRAATGIDPSSGLRASANKPNPQAWLAAATAAAMPGQRDSHVGTRNDMLFSAAQSQRHSAENAELARLGLSARSSGLNEVDRMRPRAESASEQSLAVKAMNGQAGANSFQQKMQAEALRNINDGMRAAPANAAKAAAAHAAFGRSVSSWVKPAEGATTILPALSRGFASAKTSAESFIGVTGSLKSDFSLRTMFTSIGTSLSGAFSTGVAAAKSGVTSLGTAFGSLKSGIGNLPSMIGGGLSKALQGAKGLASAFKFELAALAIYGIYKVSSALYDVVAGTERFNAALEKGVALTEQMNQKTQRSQQRKIANFSSIEDPGKRRQAIAAEIALAQKNLAGLQSSVRGAEANLAAKQGTARGGYTGNKVTQTLQSEVAEAKNQVKSAEAYVEDLKDSLSQTDVAARQLAASMAKAGDAEVQKQWEFLVEGMTKVSDAIIAADENIVLLELKLNGVPDALAKGMQQVAQLADLGAPEDKLQLLEQRIQKEYELNEALEARKDALDEEKRMQDAMKSDAEQLFANLMTPMEKFQNELDKLQTLRGEGLITDETFKRGIEAASQDVESNIESEQSKLKKKNKGDNNVRAKVSFLDDIQETALRLRSGGAAGDPAAKSEKHLSDIKELTKKALDMQKKSQPSVNTPKNPLQKKKF